jgi:hypothetical protein
MADPSRCDRTGGRPRGRQRLAGGVNGVVGDYSASISWGDGTTSSGTVGLWTTPTSGGLRLT